MKYLFLGLVMVCCAFTSVAKEPLKQIVVNGQGAVYSAPEALSFSIYIEKRGESAGKLHSEVNSIGELLINQLVKNGVKESDIQSMQVNLRPWFEREQNTQVQRGFVFSRSINITLRNIASYPEVLDVVMRGGATRIDNFQYILKDPRAAYLTALESAIHDAQLRASKMAQVASIKLGSIVSIQESSFYSPPSAALKGRMAMQESSGGFLPGEMQTQANVSVVFAIAGE